MILHMVHVFVWRLVGLPLVTCVVEVNSMYHIIPCEEQLNHYELVFRVIPCLIFRRSLMVVPLFSDRSTGKPPYVMLCQKLARPQPCLDVTALEIPCPTFPKTFPKSRTRLYQILVNDLTPGLHLYSAATTTLSQVDYYVEQ